LDKQLVDLLSDSAVIKPVYHGTQYWLDELEISAFGTLGSGIYFANRLEGAEYYGDHIVVAYVCFKSPWQIVLDYDTRISLKEDFDHPAVDAILSLPNDRALLNRAKKHEFGHFDKLLTKQLKQLGFDSIVGTYPDGSRELVAFDNNQVFIQDCIRPTSSASCNLE
jgi:hypothetical protein